MLQTYQIIKKGLKLFKTFLIPFLSRYFNSLIDNCFGISNKCFKGAIIVIPFVILSAIFLKILGKKVEVWGNIRVVNLRNLTNIIYEIVLGIRNFLIWKN